MADERVNELLDVLEASFDAGVAAADDAAASDLALSLLQDLALAEAVTRSGTVDALLAGGARMRVAEIGTDYVRGDGSPARIVPLRRVLLTTSSDGAGPVRSEHSLVSLLRALVRRRAIVEVRTEWGLHSGRLLTAALDHVAVGVSNAPGARFYIPIGAVAEVRVGAAT